MAEEVLFVIQCRYGSRRLLGKCMAPLAGIGALEFLLRRLEPLADVGRLVLATTELAKDDVVARAGRALGYDIVRGREDDVLSRYVVCMEAFNPKVVVRITADNPLTCPEQVRESVKYFSERDVDYCLTEGLPIGAAVDVFSAQALYKSAEEATEPYQREHINAYILDNRHLFRIVARQAPEELARPDLSMTMDTREDWQRLNFLFLPGEDSPWRISLAEAIERMDRRAVA